MDVEQIPRQPGRAYLTPLVRSDCEEERGKPCPHVGCKHHLAIYIKRRYSPRGVPSPPTGVRVRPGWQGDEPMEIDATPTCALDVADEGGHTLAEVGKTLDLSREMVRQIELAALRKCPPHVREYLKGRERL